MMTAKRVVGVVLIGLAVLLAAVFVMQKREADQRREALRSELQQLQADADRERAAIEGTRD